MDPVVIAFRRSALHCQTFEFLCNIACVEPLFLFQYWTAMADMCILHDSGDQPSRYITDSEHDR